MPRFFFRLRPVRKTRLTVVAGLLVCVGGLLFAQTRVVVPGDPLAGVTPVEFEEFRLGLDDFLEVETAEEGLGPAFNGASCAVCHSVPAVGGTSTIAEVRAGKRGPRGEFIALDASGESLFHLFSVPSHACQPLIPDDATIIVRRVPIPVFGAGLVEAIPDETLLALEDPSDRNRDGVSGRAAMVIDRASGERRVGRFGWKAQHATLLAFSADAYRNEMGITNDLFAQELAVGVSNERMRVCDPIPDPEDIRDPRTGRRGIDNFASFMKFLAPVARGPIDETVRNGERSFGAMGCAACHTPTLVTGPSANPLFDRREVPLFSDLLLHDVGTGDGIQQESGAPEEIRTPALWGLRLRRPLLHDGSAATIEQAIGRHAGEAELARRSVEQATDSESASLIAFLKSL
ncbi:MAG TPA: di-heme oxidoredictase family protein [Vicinamibacterales bacterium]|nr:di-heme oxidoredictase family protein [Vicinamibacterales bacterium]